MRYRNRKRDSWLYWVLADLLVLLGIVFFFFIMLASAAYADDNMQGLRGGLIIGSEHYSSTDYNEDNEGYYFCWKRVCAGEFENSYSNTFGNGDEHSRFINYEHPLGSWGPLDFTGVIGAVDGYKGLNGYDQQIMPMAGVTARFYIGKIWQFGNVTAYGIELNEGMFKHD